MRELRATSIDGKIYLFPVPVLKDRKYLIYCVDQSEAALVIQKVQGQELEHPDLLSEDFVYITKHSDGETKIYSLNPKHRISGT